MKPTGVSLTLTLLGMLILSASISAQSSISSMMNYQGRLLDDAGAGNVDYYIYY